MPACGSQIILCDVPVRFDTYRGCGHACKYCFTYKKVDIAEIDNGESAVALKSHIKGERNQETNWCDWDIPLHWGGLSDPFQPVERRLKRSLECLKVFADSGYPYIVSSKSILCGEDPEYNRLIGASNCVYQMSHVSPAYDTIECGAPTFAERLAAIPAIARVAKRFIVRIQPYTLEVHDSVLSSMPLWAEAGVYGVVAEAIKLFRKAPGLVKMGGDYVYPKPVLAGKWLELREAAHAAGLAFYSGENRLRQMGDSLACCGFEGVPGFEGNKANLNYYIFDREQFKFRPAMKVKGSALCFKTLCQDSEFTRILGNSTFEDVMNAAAHDRAKLMLFAGEESQDGE